MAQGTVNDMVDNAVNQSAARTIQSAVRNDNAIKEVATRYADKQIVKIKNAVRGHQARKEFKNQILNKATSENKAATSIQTATRGHLARNELGNRINAAEQQQARNTLTSAIRSRKARHELATNQQQFNPIDYQDALRANKKTFQNQVLDYTDRRPQPITEKQSKKLDKAKNRIESINKLTEKRKQPGRPPGPSSRLSTVSRLSTAATLPPNSPGAAFTPHKK